MSVTDNFNRADGVGLGANWTEMANGCEILSNQFKYNGGTGALYSGSYWSANGWNANQTSQITKKNSNSYLAPMVRCSGSGSGRNGYFFFDNASIQKVVAGSATNLAGGTATVNGDVMKLDVTGTTLTAYVNGSSSFSTTDSSLSSGSAGLGGYPGGADILGDDWVGTGEISSTIYPDYNFRQQQRRPASFRPMGDFGTKQIQH